MTFSTSYGEYDLFLVGLSYLISVCGSFTALRLAGQLRRSSESDRWTWLGLSALAMGGVAIWSMHFINPKMASMKNQAPLMTHQGHPIEKRVELPETYITTIAAELGLDIYQVLAAARLV